MIPAGMGVNDDADEAAFDEPGGVDRSVGPSRAQRSATRRNWIRFWDVPEDTCWTELGKPPIGAAWVRAVKNSLGRRDRESGLVGSDLAAGCAAVALGVAVQMGLEGNHW